MKKTIIWVVVLFALAPTVFAVSYGDYLLENFSYAEGADVPNWDEQEGFIGGWSIGSVVMSDVGTVIFNSSGTDGDLFIRREINSSSVDYLGFRMKANSTGAEGYMALENGSNSELIRIGFEDYYASNGYISVYNGTQWYKVQVANNSQYYVFEMKNIDYDLDTFDLYVDGNLKNLSYGLRFDVSDISYVSFHAGHSGIFRNLSVDWVRVGVALESDVSIDKVSSADEDVLGRCNASFEVGGGNVTYETRWYNGSSLFNSSNSSLFEADGGWDIVSELNKDYVSLGDSWVFSCFAKGRGVKSFWENVSVTLANLSLDNCSTFTNRSAQFTIYDEQFPSTSLNAYVEFEGTYWQVPGITYPFSFISNNSDSYGLCISDDNITLYSDIYVKYTTDSGFTHRYYLYNVSLSNETQNFSLYNFDTQTGISDVTITLRDDYDYTYKANVVGKVQRKYVGEGVWRTVQMDQSGDYGQLLYNIEEEDTDYRFIFMDTDNHILSTTQSMKFICTSTHCSVTYTLSDFSGFGIANNLSIKYSYNNVSGVVSVNWSDPSGRTAAFTTTVSRETGKESIVVCSNVTSASSGSQGCDISGLTGTFVVSSYGTIDGVKIYALLETIEKRSGALWSVVDEAEASLWVAGLVSVCFMFGLFSPAGAVLSVILGLVVAKLFGFLSVLSVGLVVVVAALGVVIGLKVKQ